MGFTAKGSARLKDGYLSEVPLVLSILKLLNLSLPRKEAFHTANIKYSVIDKVINIEALEVFSDSVELGCIGTVSFDSTIDLTVVAGFNKETFSQIPNHSETLQALPYIDAHVPFMFSHVFICVYCRKDEYKQFIIPLVEQNCSLCSFY